MTSKKSYKATKPEIKISLSLALIIFISCISIWNIEFIGNLLLTFLLPISILFEPPIFLYAISLNTIDGVHLKLYKNSIFQYKYASFLGTKKYYGNHKTKGDTIILTFEIDKPEYIEKKTTKWIIEGNQFVELSENLYFDIVKQ